MALRQIASGDRFLILPVLSRETLKKQLTAALKDAAFGLDIPGQVVSHRLRHTYATELLNAGMSLVGIMKLLGHRSLNMTMRYAALTQHTVVKDYYKAMAQIARQYELPTATSSCTIDKPNPDRMLRDVISHLRKNALAGSNTQRLIARIHKLRHEIAHLDTAPCSPMKHPCARKQSAG